MKGIDDIGFRKVLEEAFGAENAQKALDAMAGPASVSVRLNPDKPIEGFGDASRVPWSPEGRILSQRPSFTLDPLFHAGCYYVQDSSAMFVGEAVRQMALPELRKIEGRPVRVLDLCAAPGGKTTDLASSLRQVFSDGFILVANEVMKQRVTVLADNVAIWGDPNVVVTNADPKAFASLKGFFDLIVADVPCSGEGMFRKDAQAVAEWSADTVALCESRQRRIVGDVWDALSDGGMFVYSTCTFNVRENDGNAEWIAGDLGASVLPMENLPEGVLATRLGASLVPGLVPGEGQYCAVLKKDGQGLTSQKRKSNGKQGRERNLSGLESLFDIKMNLSLKGDTVIAVPSVIAEEVAALGVLRPLRTCLGAGEMKGSTFVPGADLALCYALSPSAYPRVEVSRETALMYLHRDSITLADAPKGYVLICYQDHPLGFVKNLGNRCNSLHPQGRRIRMDVNL